MGVGSAGGGGVVGLLGRMQGPCKAGAWGVSGACE